MNVGVRILRVILCLGILASLITSVAFLISNPVSFDGAFHLQAVETLMRDGLPAVTYSGYHPFDHSIQMGLPFLLSLGLAFALFGSTLLVAKIVSFGWFLLMAMAAYLLVRRYAGVTLALLVVLAILLMPGYDIFALTVYGEPASLALLLFAVWLLDGRPSRRVAFIAGILIALAILTKTVLLLSVLALVVLGLVHLVVGQRSTFRQILWVIAGVVFSLLLYEVWRWVVLGHAAYVEYMLAQAYEVLYQGTGVGFEKMSLGTRIANNWATLAEYGNWRWIWLIPVALQIIGSLLGLVISRDAGVADAPEQRNRIWSEVRHWRPNPQLGLSLLVILAVGYFTWWMVVSPMPFYRRVLNALVLLLIALTPLLTRRFRNSTTGSLLSVLAAAFMLLHFANGLLVRDWHWNVEPVQYPLAEYLEETQQPGRLIAGYNWWQAPRYSWILDYDAIDLEDPADRMRMQPGRDLVIITQEQRDYNPDSAAAIDHFTGERLYRAPNGDEVYRYQRWDFGDLDLSGSETWARTLKFENAEAEKDQLIHGFHRPEWDRSVVWMQPDSAVVMPATETDRSLKLVGWIREKAMAHHGEPMVLTLDINGETRKLTFSNAGNFSRLIPLPGPGRESVWRIRMSSNYAYTSLSLGINSDTRVLSFLLKELAITDTQTEPEADIGDQTVEPSEPSRP